MTKTASEKPAAPPLFTVLKDTREQQGWEFVKGKSCAGMESATLKTGDYTVKGMETSLTIERKGSMQELSGNLFDARFYRELERMKEYKHAYLLLEFTAEQLLGYPLTADLPSYVKAKIRVNGSLLMSKLIQLQIDYPVKVIFAGKRGKDIAYYILKAAYDGQEKN